MLRYLTFKFYIMKHNQSFRTNAKKKWSMHYAFEVADEFLPHSPLFKCDGLEVYDDAGIFGSNPNLQNKLSLGFENYSVRLFTYTNAFELEQKKQNIISDSNDILMFIKKTSSNDLEISLNLGRNFKNFFNSNSNKSVHDVQTSSLSSVSKKINSALSHSSVLNLLFDSFNLPILSEETLYDEVLKEYLIDHKIDAFIFKNTCNNKKTYLLGKLENGELSVRHITRRVISQISPLDESCYDELFAYQKNGLWITSRLPISDCKTNLKKAENPYFKGEIDMKSMLNTVKRHVEYFPNVDTPDNQFLNLTREIQAQINNPFYQEIGLQVNLSYVSTHRNMSIEGYPKKGNTETSRFITSNTDDINNYEIGLDIIVDEKGQISIKHKINPCYLEEYEGKWKTEAKKRGLDLNIADLRKQVLKDFTSIETEQRFFDRFIQNTESFFSGGQVGGYIEAIQATQKVAKNVWSEGTINESLWYSKSDKYNEWPSYLNHNPILGGATDGVVDEITGIPLAIKSVYGIATDEKQRESLAQVFTKDGFVSLLEGMKKEAIETVTDGEQLEYFTGKTTVSVASTLSGVGIISKAGKTGDFLELLEQTAKKVDDLPNPKVHRITDLVKKNKRTVSDEIELKKLIDDIGDEKINDAASELLDLAKLTEKQKKKFTWEEIKAFFKRGNDFNKKMVDLEPPIYQFHEVTVEHVLPNGKIKKYRLDSYNEGLEIVSRKATDFDQIQTSTFEGYLRELIKKYPPGTKITAPKYPELKGQTLQGKLKLEVPETNKTSKKLKEFEKLAKKYDIEIVFQPE